MSALGCVTLTAEQFADLVLMVPIATAFALGFGWSLGNVVQSMIGYAARRVSKRYAMHRRARVRRDWGV